MSAYVDIIRPNSKNFGLTFDILCVLAGSFFLGFMSQFAFHLWFTPIPITLQTFGVLMLGALLGSKRGACSVLTYLAQGGLGLPVFAGGASGFASLFGPGGGYFFSFVFAAFIVGYLLERGWKNRYSLTLAALAIGDLLILGVGSLWLSSFVGIKYAFALGVYPFLIGEFLKIAALAALIPTGWKGLKHNS